MGFSKLCRNIVLADESNYTKGRNGYKICKFTPHHMAGILTGEQCAQLFQRASRNASANYCIGNDGGIVGCVDEDNRAWTSSSRSNDYQAITVEVSDCEVGGEWRISEAAWNSLVDLAVDVCTRYGFKLVYDGTPNSSLTRHNMFANTNCPGPYLQSKFDELARIVNERLEGGNEKLAEAPKVEIPQSGHYVGEVVRINGIYTASNSTRKLNPARNSGTITKIIPGAVNPYLLNNGNLGWTNDDCIESATAAPSNQGQAPVQNSAPSISVGSKVTLSGNASNYATGQKIPNSIKNKQYTIMQVGNGKVLLKEIYSWVYIKDLVGVENAQPVQNNRKSNEEIADAIINQPNFGGWGTGEERKNKLRNAGYDPSAIQRIINQKLK